MTGAGLSLVFPFCRLHSAFPYAFLNSFLHHLLDFIPLDFCAAEGKAAARILQPQRCPSCGGKPFSHHSASCPVKQWWILFENCTFLLFFLPYPAVCALLPPFLREGESVPTLKGAFPLSFLSLSAWQNPRFCRGKIKKPWQKKKVKKSFVLQRKKNGTEILKGRRGFSQKVSLSQNAMKYQRELVYQ